jgi:hypothetical protein
MTWFSSANFWLQRENELLTSTITEKISIKQLIKTLSFSRQLERIEKLFKKKIQRHFSKQQMSSRCKNNLRTKRKRIKTIRLTKKMSRKRIKKNLCLEMYLFEESDYICKATRSCEWKENKKIRNKMRQKLKIIKHTKSLKTC